MKHHPRRLSLVVSSIYLGFLIGAWFAVLPAAAQQQADETEKAQKISVQAAGQEAVVVYSEPNYRGRSERFLRDDRRLDDNRIGNDGPASIRVPRGCRATLYEHYDYVGISSEVRQNVPDLRRTRLGSKEASSIKVSCKPVNGDPGGDSDRQLRGREGVLLFSETGFRGRYQFFNSAQSDLSLHAIGDDAVSSVRLARGCRLLLFADQNFKGKAAEIAGDLPNLRRTSIGPDTASSLILDCGQPGGGVTLFSDSHFRGEQETFTRDIARLADSRLGENRVGSVRVAPGCRATLFDQPGFRGRPLRVEKDAVTLVDSQVGPDAASSVRVECKGKPTNDGELPYGSGALLYDRSYYLGEGIRVRDDVPRLSQLPIGNDRTSSIRVAPGCEVRLFRDANFSGRGILIDESIDDLDRIPEIGSNELSSIRIRCNSWRR